jgi:acyl-CoA synthetase (AMP-forming)/AMP-acid ligase II
MLESRWRAVVAAHWQENALLDVASGRSWTFAGLASAADQEVFAGAAQMAYPGGTGPEFILAVLRAWRARAVVCPLEPGQLPPAVPGPPAGIRHLKLTSGTSGLPKCVAFTAAQLAADADAIVPTMGLRREWPNLGVISLAHSYGFSNLVLPLLLHGIPLILASAPLPAAVLAAARRMGDQPLTLPAVPAMWRAWHESDSIPANVRLAISAGAVLPLGLEQAIHGRSGLKIHNFLGASECGGIAYDRTTEPRTDPTLVGQPLDGVRLSVASDDRLQVEGPSVGTTYWPNSDVTLSGGRYLTGDLAELTPAGVFLRGRAGDVINVAGRKLAPETVEAALRLHPGVRECLVLGLPADDPRGEAIAAVVAGGPGLSGPLLREHLLNHLPAWQVPKVWQLEATLTPNGRGKLSRAEWRARLLAAA